MALNKILSGLLQSFSDKYSLTDLTDTKLYEYLVNYLVVSKFHPDAFSDLQDLEKIDIDQGSMFGLDAIAFIVNENLVINKSDIDIYARSKSLDVKIIFIQTKTEEKYDTGAILKTINAVKNFFGDRRLLENSSNLQNAIEIFEELCAFKYSKYFTSRSIDVLIYYVTAAKPCEEKLVFDICESENKNIKKTIGEIKQSNIFVLGSDYIIDSYNEIENRIEVIINFKNNLSLDKIEKVEQSYLGYLPGDDYLKMITDKQGNLRRRLFYENVRDFQGDDNTVNKEISATIETADLQDKFILLNNGVTVVAKYFKALGSNSYEMRDFQIVNGCQTSNVIYLSKKHAKEILVPIKIIHTNDIDLISKIVKATNRQTPVPKEAFITLERYHKLIQEIFETYSKEMPLQIYYERRSGEFQFLERKLLSYQIINLHSLIRGITSVYFQDAYVVHNNNPANILRNRADKLFNEDHKLEVYYISNYLLALLSVLQYNKKMSVQDLKMKYYIVMVVRSLLAGKTKVGMLNSEETEKEAKRIISILKTDQKKAENAFTNAHTIITQSINEYRKGKDIFLERILRDPEFNQLVGQKTKEFLSVKK